MALDCVMEYVVKPIYSFGLDTAKDYVSYIRSYDDNITSLINELENLKVTKEELNNKVNGMEKLVKITPKAAFWLNKVSILSQNEELKKLVVCEQKIAEKVLLLMEKKDLKKVLREGDEMMIGVVIKVMMEVHDENNNETDQEFKWSLKGIVVEVMKETTDKFKKMIIQDIKVALIVMTILKDEDVAKLSDGNKEMVDTLEKGRKMFEEESLEIDDTDERRIKDDIRNLVRPFEKLVKNDNFMKDMAEDMKLGVEMMNGLCKELSPRLKDESAIKENKDKDGHRHHCCYYFKHFHNRYEMSKSAEKMTNDIKSIIGKTPTSVTSPRNIEDTEAIPSGFVVGVKSREKCLQVILTKLRDDQVNCVGVYGMGGIGKTTLANEVKSRAKGIFDKITLAAISESPNIESIQDQVAEGLGLSLVDVHSTGPRAQMLYNMLLEVNKGKKERDQGERKGKIKILIILDNMWHKLNLSEVGIPFVSTNEFCCKILVTSRDRNVCEMMGIKGDDIIELGLLGFNESKKLFQHHVNKTIDEGDYKLVAQKLLEKCNRLPLNIMTTANMLKEKDLSTWQHFVDELEKPISGEVSSVRGETYKILETSYKFLESEEKKTFFLLACLSPLDSSISVDNLMRYGVGLDLFQNVNKLSEALDQASKWVSELVSSSLLLKDDDSLSHVKIHDDVRVSAMSFAEKDKQQHKFLVNAVPRWMCKESFNKYTAISLFSGAHDLSRLNAVKAELLQILLLKGMRSDTSELADGFFQGMPNLKVLHLSCMTLEPHLPTSIVQLKNLKTLQLEHCELGDISLMCMLTELVVVSLRYSILEKLPAEMGKLVNLRILDMGGCKFESATNTKVIAKLSSLEGLYLFDKWATDHEFNELPHLNLLEVVYLLDQNNYNLTHLPLSRFFKHLDRFSIVFAKDATASSMLKTYYRASPLQHRALQFTGLFRDLLDIQALKDSSCIEALIKRTEYLLFDSTKLKKNLVPELDKDGFRDLKHLQVSKCKGMECVNNTDIDGPNNLIAFQNLECLKLDDLGDLKMICKGNAPPSSRMFSNLRHLELAYLSHLEYTLPLALLPKNLTEIKIQYCKMMKFIFNDNDYCLPSYGNDHNEKVVIDLPLLKLLSIDSSDLVSLVGPVAKADAFYNTKINCPSLEHLTVDSCSTTMYLWSKELDIFNFRNLKEMKISRCTGLQSLRSNSVLCALVQLEILTISLSSGLQEIITKETEEQKTIEFRHLRELKLDHLDSLKSFYEGSYTVKFPKLKKLEMQFLPKMTAFVGSVDPSTTLFSDKVEFHCLEELEVIGVIKDTNMQLWNWDGAVKDEDAPKLRKVKIESIKGLRSIPNIISTNVYSLHLYDVNKTSEDKVLFSFSTSESQVVQLPKLEELYVQSFPELKTLFEREDNNNGHENGMLATCCRQLKQLTLEDLPELSPVPLHSFNNLRVLYIKKLNWKYVFPTDVVFSSLEVLRIKSCGNMDVVIMDDEKEGGDNVRVERFPRLKTLNLSDLNIYSFSTRSYSTFHYFSSLEALYIYGCNKLESFWSGPGPFIAPKLQQVFISGCDCMKWFLSGELTQVELLSLQLVQIYDAPCMKSFSATPLKAPKLRSVFISDCIDMDWILPGYPNHDDVLDLPSLVRLGIYNSKLETFSTGPLKAPKLTHAMIDGRNFDIGELEFKQFLEGYKPTKDNKDEGDKQESKHKSEGEIQESTCKEENHDKGNH